MPFPCPRCGARVVANVTISGRVKCVAMTSLDRCANRLVESSEWNVWTDCPDLKAEIGSQTAPERAEAEALKAARARAANRPPPA